MAVLRIRRKPVAISMVTDGLLLHQMTSTDARDPVELIISTSPNSIFGQ